MRPCKKVSSLRLVLVVAMLGTGLSGVAHASGWMDASLGLAPLKFDPSGQIRNRYLHSFSNAPDMQTYAGAAGGSDEPVDLEAISKEMDNPLGSLWLLFIQNDTIQLSDDFPLKDKQWINVTLFQPILPIPIGKDWLRPAGGCRGLRLPGAQVASSDCSLGSWGQASIRYRTGQPQCRARTL